VLGFVRISVTLYRATGRNRPLFSDDLDDAEKDSENDMLRGLIDGEEVCETCGLIFSSLLTKSIKVTTPEFDLNHSAHSAIPFSIPVLPKEALVKALSQQTMPSRKEIGSLSKFLAPFPFLRLTSIQ
jgi:hypothetical protein